MSTAAIILQEEHIPVVPDPVHEFTVSTKLAASGFGVSDTLIRRHKQEHADELVEGKHWVVQKMNTLGGAQRLTLWTKRGIIRLGFFINSERAKRFRDAAEDLIIRNGVVVSPQAPLLTLEGRKYASAGISITPDQLVTAKARAKECRMTWSAYVRACIDIEVCNTLLNTRPRIVVDRTSIAIPCR